MYRPIFCRLILTILYLSAPLYLSFFTYWVFFHSFSSLVETSQFLNNSRDIKSLIISLKKSLPFTLVSILGILIIYFVIGNFSEEVLISVFFLIISCLTIPHMIVVQAMYKYLVKAKYYGADLPTK